MRSHRTFQGLIVGRATSTDRSSARALRPHSVKSSTGIADAVRYRCPARSRLLGAAGGSPDDRDDEPSRISSGVIMIMIVLAPAAAARAAADPPRTDPVEPEAP